MGRSYAQMLMDLLRYEFVQWQTRDTIMRDAQRKDWALGNIKLSNEDVTEDMVQKAIDSKEKNGEK